MPPGTWDSGAGATVTCRNPCIFLALYTALVVGSQVARGGKE